MTNQSIADELFFTRTGLTEKGAQAALGRVGTGADAAICPRRRPC